MLRHLLPPLLSPARRLQSKAPASRSASTSSTSGRDPRRDGISQEYLTDPSQWWDDTAYKTNQQPADFSHKHVVEKMEGEKWISQSLNVLEAFGGNAKQEQAYLNYEDPSLALNLMLSGHISAPNMLKLDEDSRWGTLEQAFSISGGMAELPSIETVICILQKCRKERNLANAMHLHAYICNNGLEAHIAVGNYVVPMFVECGSVPDAQQVFNRLVHRNVHSWTSLILGYIECGQSDHALNLYQHMQEDHVHPSSYTLMALLKACSRMKDAAKGREVHIEIAQRGFQSNIFVGSTLVDMYAKCCSLSEAREVFDNLPIRNVVTWNALIAGYAEHGPVQEALNCFEKMQMDGVFPDAVTFVCILKACSNIRAIEKGREIHAEIKERGLEKNPFVGSILVDMYANCGLLSEAQEVFGKLPISNVVTWNALIAGYAEHGAGEEALDCFEKMQLEGILPNAVTFICTLKACGSIGAIDKGRELHMEIKQKGFERILFVGSTLVDMYSRCGSLLEAWEVFDKLPNRNVVTWNALITGYAEHGPGQEVLNCFEQMKLEGIFPNAITFVCVLKACGNIGALYMGREIHTEVRQKGFELNLFVGSTLVDMYARCGSLLEAREVFDKMPVRGVVSWNAMINGYGMNHEGNMAVQCFEEMQEYYVKPDGVTFTCLLTACSRSNLIFKGQDYFKVMKEDYGIVPSVDHCTCMVDLLARSGHLYEAEKFLETMPCLPSIDTWTALLSACKTYGEAELGFKCFQKLIQINPGNAVLYVLMGNIYSSAGRMDEAYRIEEMRKLAGAKKKPASALVEVNKRVHEFLVGDNQSKEISAMLEMLNSRMKEEGHVVNLDMVLRSISDEEKETALCEHAEKLAVAFGLLNTPEGQTLRVIKNMRMCNNCHDANKILSRIERREIIVRDSYCVHHFKDGLCSCTVVF